MTIPAETYAKLRNTLLSCWPFESTMQSAALFLDARLAPWRHGLPQAHFGEEDLPDLCFYLDGVDFDSLPGRGKAAKARELLLYLERRRQLRPLLDVGRTVRPDVPWHECGRAG